MIGAIVSGVVSLGKSALGYATRKTEEARATERKAIETRGAVRIAAQRAAGGLVMLGVTVLWCAPLAAAYWDPETGRAMAETLESFPEWYQDRVWYVSGAALGLKAVAGKAN